MKDEQIRLVQSSFARVFARKAELAERFYVHLFERLPDAKSLFRGDFFAQKEMFATMLASTVRGMNDVQAFHTMGQALARSHARFNLRRDDLDKAAEALSAAFRDVFGDTLNAQEQEAWDVAMRRLTRMLATPE
ncbi:globin domain protein [Ruegeria pomeroyi]|jgi:hemoglobin-like flavoprotein|uniref:Globin domain protein n=2 Tax=Ruegeria pomeroyi TaxID=89184 RepID=Q5LN83_RUEPO|nr:globin domain-containing protein [Ruegeria pomeroyi]HCE69720.1 globin domain protein [Ruegeria sp.]AAV96556.1 globin domain protein [Ruegeria pomeroyi DSS-3]NVK96148.1 globin domain protein [Ruegeria pomeroyi]NVL01024.1 globin domain protein [Ruegeria pomeroyi]QWV10098.1 globin domain protein [Ruegeria pomeroyi]